MQRAVDGVSAGLPDKVPRIPDDLLSGGRGVKKRKE